MSKEYFSPYTLDAVPGCVNDNWGMPHQERKPFRSTTYAELQGKCEASFMDNIMSDFLPAAMVNYYPTTPDFKQYVGEDWVPENNHLFPRPLTPYQTLDATARAPKTMHAKTCDAEMDDGSTWSVTRIGPIVSVGKLRLLLMLCLFLFCAHHTSLINITAVRVLRLGSIGMGQSF
jgi:hypothetical protein